MALLLSLLFRTPRMIKVAMTTTMMRPRAPAKAKMMLERGLSWRKAFRGVGELLLLAAKVVVKNAVTEVGTVTVSTGSLGVVS
jgi:hypothetical protein